MSAKESEITNKDEKHVDWKKVFEHTKLNLLLKNGNGLFYANLLLDMPFVESKETIAPAWTDGNSIYYSPELMDKIVNSLDLPTDNSLTLEAEFVMVHEVLHCALLHHIRGKDIFAYSMEKGEYSQDCWLAAVDYAVNNILEEDYGSTRIYHDFALKDKEKQYKNMTAEQIYQELIKNAVKIPISCASLFASNAKGRNKKQTSAGVVFGDVKPGSNSDEENTAQKIKWESKVAQTAEIVARVQGTIPGSFQSILEKLGTTDLNWQEILANYTSKIFEDDYSWAKPSRRYIYRGMYMPSLESEEAIRNIVFAIDSSGSISENELLFAMSSVADILNLYNNVEIKVIQADSEIQKIFDVDKNTDISELKELYGRGGTDFRPVFDYIKDNMSDVKLLIYLTDTYGTFPEKAPGYNVIWLTYTEDTEVPFGEKIYVKPTVHGV